MINWKMIYKIMGFLLFIEAGFLSLCIALSALYDEPDLPAFIISTLITIAVGVPLSYAGKHAERKLSPAGFAFTEFVVETYKLV